MGESVCRFPAADVDQDKMFVRRPTMRHPFHERLQSKAWFDLR